MASVQMTFQWLIYFLEEVALAHSGSLGILDEGCSWV